MIIVHNLGNIKKSVDFIKDAEPKKPYGEVDYADPGHQADKKKRYPIDTEAHIRAAWSYINKPGNASQYEASDLASVRAKIVSAWKRVIDKDGPPSAQKSMGQAEGGLEMSYDTAVATTEPVSMAAYVTGAEPIDPQGCNVTILSMEYDIRDGVICPTSLNVRNWDQDPDGEEELGSEDEKREVEHYGRVMEMVAHWLMTGEEHEGLPDGDDDTIKDEEGTRDEGKDTPSREDLGDIAMEVAGLERYR